MEYFVNKGSIVRKIWGQTDAILFIFAGAAAEFALNKAVDWLYFTGRLPADPLGRLFSTVAYSQQIIFSERDAANHAIDKITGIHKTVEENRGAQIPDWAYRDVLFMLIDYSVRSFEVLQRKLTPAEKAEVFDVFYRVGIRMGINGLPANYNDWQVARQAHLQTNMVNSHFTVDLYKQYKKHLGIIRYLILKQVQVLIVPKKVSEMLSLGKTPYLLPVLALYKLTRLIKLDKVLIISVLPKAYQAQVKGLLGTE
jgi:hypothetical protein